MKEETGQSYTSANWGKWLVASDPKIGKTSWMIASALGVFPGQKRGGIVDKPSNLHVITFDEAALRGVKDFLLETCKAPETALDFKVYNMEEDFKKITVTAFEYDRDFYNAVIKVVDGIRGKLRGTPLVMVSSLTSLAEGVLRGTSGPAAQKRGAGMDQSKWPDFALQMTELRNHVQGLPAHVMWEGHIYRVPAKAGVPDAEPEDTLQIPGRTGINFPMNVGFVAKLRRSFGQKIPGHNAEPMFLDTKAAFSFAAGGRGFNEKLGAQETDLTNVFKKLGLQVGNWGRVEGAVKKQKQAVNNQSRSE